MNPGQEFWILKFNFMYIKEVFMRTAFLLSFLVVMSISSSCFAEEEKKAKPSLTCHMTRMWKGPFGDMPVNQYQAHNLPIGQKFRVIFENLKGPTCEVEGIVEEDGRLKVSSLTDKTQQIYLDEWEHPAIGLYLPGEPLTLSLISPDEKIKISTINIHNPIEAYGSGDAHISLILTDINCKKHLLAMQGFTPFEKININYHSCDKIVSSEVEIWANGAQKISLVPYSSEWSGGKTTIEIIRSNKETLSLTYDWGDVAIAAFKERKRQRQESRQLQAAIADKK